MAGKTKNWTIVGIEVGSLRAERGKQGSPIRTLLRTYPQSVLPRLVGSEALSMNPPTALSSAHLGADDTRMRWVPCNKQVGGPCDARLASSLSPECGLAIRGIHHDHGTIAGDIAHSRTQTLRAGPGRWRWSPRQAWPTVVTAEFVDILKTGPNLHYRRWITTGASLNLSD